jgi:hypothetical protein
MYNFIEKGETILEKMKFKQLFVTTKQKTITQVQIYSRVLLQNDTDLVLAAIIKKVPLSHEVLLLNEEGVIMNYSKTIGDLL